MRPVQGVIGVFAWLRRENYVLVAPSAMLETPSDGFAVCSRVVQQNSPWHMFECSLCDTLALHTFSN